MDTTRSPSFSWILLAGLLLALGLAIFQSDIYEYFLRDGQNDCSTGRKRFFKDYGVKMPMGFQVYGIDVSHYSCDIDWESVEQMNVNGMKVKFAFLRATIGDYGKDNRFDENWAKLKGLNIKRGAYHFYKIGEDADAQARNFLKNVVIESGDLPPVLDIERNKDRKGKALPESSINKAKLLKDLARWIQIVEAQTGMKPIIYCNYDWYKLYIAGSFLEYPIWIAQYNRPRPSPLTAHNTWHFWQFSEKGRANGIVEKIDLNVFNGTEQQLLRLCKP